MKNFGDSVLSIVGDNCFVHAFTAEPVCLRLVRCASHSFNFAIKDMMEPSLIIVKEVHVLMKECKVWGFSSSYV